MVDIEITGDLPRVKQVELTREGLAAQYREVLSHPDNGLLGRMEGALRDNKWTEEEIRTAQLLTSMRSNASLLARVRELETAVAQMTATTRN